MYEGGHGRDSGRQVVEERLPLTTEAGEGDEGSVLLDRKISSRGWMDGRARKRTGTRGCVEGDEGGERCRALVWSLDALVGCAWGMNGWP